MYFNRNNSDSRNKQLKKPEQGQRTVAPKIIRELETTSVFSLIRGIRQRGHDVVEKMDCKKWERMTDRDLNHTWRGEYFARFVDETDKTVMDVGSGNRLIESHLPKGCEYIPVDYCDRGRDDVLICDFDKHEFPERNADVVVLLSVLQWVDDPNWLLDKVCEHANKKVLFNYITPIEPDDKTVIAKREGEGIKNHFPLPYLIAQFNQRGMLLSDLSRIKLTEGRFEGDFVFTRQN